MILRKELTMKKCLIVVDYQNDFVSGSLGFDGAEKIDPLIADKINKYHKNNDDVLFTMDTHYDDYLSTREGKRLPVAHCIEGSKGHCLYGKTAEAFDATVDKMFCKSGFGAEKLFEYLKNTQYSSIELVGVVTNMCVISNAVIAKTAQPQTDIFVDASCVASNDNDLNECAIKVMASMQIDIINNEGGADDE